VTLKVRFTPSARVQFLEVVAFVHRDNPAAANMFRQVAEQTLSRLEDFPESSRTLPEFPDLPFREVIVAPYRFFYRVKCDRIWFVAVWHGAQIPDEPGAA
jgi:toxin ParE1/3/4